MPPRGMNMPSRGDFHAPEGNRSGRYFKTSRYIKFVGW